MESYSEVINQIETRRFQVEVRVSIYYTVVSFVFECLERADQFRKQFRNHLAERAAIAEEVSDASSFVKEEKGVIAVK